MDILNDNDDVHMADSNNDVTNNNGEDGGDGINNNNRDGNGVDIDIDHEQLRQLSNYADQNQDDDTWYWNGGHVGLGPNPIGWPRYRPLSNLSEEEREEIRVGETKMVSHMNPRHYVGTGISLDWGEYYVADDEMNSSDDDEQCSLSLHEEAEEIDDDEHEREDRQALESIINSDVDAPVPTLMGMPDIILEKILHYSTDQPSAVCVVERVCKSIRRLTTGDEFWLRHPLSTKGRSSILGRTNKWHDNCVVSRSDLYVNLKRCKEDISDLPFTRQLAFELEAVARIRYFQNNNSNVILDILDGSDCVAGTFRTISADILSSMNHLGPDAHFGLRGDTIGYLCELLQGYMIDRLQVAICLAIHKLGRVDQAVGISRTVQGDDIALAFRRQRDVFSFPSSFSSRGQMRWGVQPTESLLDCSLSLPSSSGIIWKWPGDNCHDALPPEAGRRIIRRLAYASGILHMSNVAFILAEAELLHALGVLLVTAYESSVEMAKTTQLLGAEEVLAYDAPPSSFIDMFRSPPPPFQEEQLVHTIVPGQIRSAAEERGITRYKVYGSEWIASSGFTKEEEMNIEKSYYCEDEDDEDEEESGTDSSDIEGNRSRLDNSIDSDSEAEIEEGEEDSVMDMDDYEPSVYWDSNWADSHISMLG